jgi:uncharacterized protein YwqG
MIYCKLIYRFLKHFSIFTVIAMTVCIGCKPPVFSEVPYIEFRSLEKIDNNSGYDDEGILKFYFEDGDGDIGLEENIPDTLDNYNFFIEYYEKQNGNFVLVEPKITMNARIPPLSYTVPESISGIISIKRFINNNVSKYDTVKFDFYIVDRKKNRSNTATTGEIIIKKH